MSIIKQDYDTLSGGNIVIPKIQINTTYSRSVEMSVKGVNTLYVHRVTWSANYEANVAVTVTSVDFDEADPTVSLQSLGGYSTFTTLKATDTRPITYEFDVSQYTAIRFNIVSTDMVARLYVTGVS